MTCCCAEGMLKEPAVPYQFLRFDGVLVNPIGSDDDVEIAVSEVMIVPYPP